MRIAVVGGGSTYTPELVDGLLRRRADLPMSALTLVDPSERRLAVLGPFVTRMVEAAGGDVTVEITGDLHEGVRGAALVFSQFRVGGQAARHADELLGRRHGLVGQETTGVGGFAKGLRTIPAALEVQAAVAEVGRPDAWLVNFTNPAGMVTEALLAHGAGNPPRVIGLCNWPWVLRTELAPGLGARPQEIDLDYVGLNHLAWVRDVTIGGQPRFADAQQAYRGTGPPFAARLLDDLGLILNPYLQYYYETSRVLAEQQRTHTRAETVAALEEALLERYAEPRLAYSPDLLRGRGGASYSEAATALAADLAADRDGRHVVNVRSGGALPGVAEDVVIETTCRVGAQGAVPVPTAPLGPPIRGLVNQVKDYELYAVEAAITGDRRVARLALLAHPLCPDALGVDALLDDLLVTNRALLANFA